MKKIILSLIILLVAFAAYSQSASDFNGVFWQSLTYEGRVVFLIGMAHGELSAFQTLYNMEERAILDVLATRLNDLRTIDVMIAAIDKFYNDNPKELSKPVFVVYLFTLEGSRGD